MTKSKLSLFEIIDAWFTALGLTALMSCVICLTTVTGFEIFLFDIGWSSWIETFMTEEVFIFWCFLVTVIATFYTAKIVKKRVNLRRRMKIEFNKRKTSTV
jgi:hypothetical protein